jgi:hypothetical protein
MLFSTKYSEIDDTSVLTRAMHGRQATIFQSPEIIIFCFFLFIEENYLFRVFFFQIRLCFLMPR